MSNAVLIIGESGTGKSTSLRNLDHNETYIINVLDKPLPFKGWKTKYIKKEGGNYGVSDRSPSIIRLMQGISDKREDIKNIIIDDFQFTMTNEYMRRARENGYQKFTDVGVDAFEISDKCTSLRDDITVIVLAHSEVNKKGVSTLKTIGEMVNKYVDMEAKFTVALHAIIIDHEIPSERYKFLTNRTSNIFAKSPAEMFDEIIPNDLSFVLKRIHEYNLEENDFKGE